MAENPSLFLMERLGVLPWREIAQEQRAREQLAAERQHYAALEENARAQLGIQSRAETRLGARDLAEEAWRAKQYDLDQRKFEIERKRVQTEEDRQILAELEREAAALNADRHLKIEEEKAQREATDFQEKYNRAKELRGKIDSLNKEERTQYLENLEQIQRAPRVGLDLPQTPSDLYGMSYQQGTLVQRPLVTPKLGIEPETGRLPADMAPSDLSALTPTPPVRLSGELTPEQKRDFMYRRINTAAEIYPEAAPELWRQLIALEQAKEERAAQRELTKTEGMLNRLSHENIARERVDYLTGSSVATNTRLASQARAVQEKGSIDSRIRIIQTQLTAIAAAQKQLGTIGSNTSETKKKAWAKNEADRQALQARLDALSIESEMLAAEAAGTGGFGVREVPESELGGTNAPPVVRLPR
jgi:hypothetical protein